MQDERHAAEAVNDGATILANLVTIGGIVIGFLAAVWRWGRWLVRESWAWARGLGFARSLADRRIDQVLDELRKKANDQHWGVEELRLRIGAAEAMLELGGFTADPEQSIDWLSPHAVVLLGYDSSDLLGRNWLARINDEAREELGSAWALACGKRIATSCTIETIKGARLLVVLCPSVNERGEVISVYGQLRKVRRWTKKQTDGKDTEAQ